MAVAMHRVLGFGMAKFEAHAPIRRHEAQHEDEVARGIFLQRVGPSVGVEGTEPLEVRGEIGGWHRHFDHQGGTLDRRGRDRDHGGGFSGSKSGS